jgi:hypothetical protein
VLDFELFSDSNLQAFTWKVLAVAGVIKMLLPAFRGVWKSSVRTFYRARRDTRRARRELESDSLLPKSG